MIVLLIAGGFACGVINALAGGGSFITFPLLMMTGLSPQVANATNRIAIVLQAAAGTATYHRYRVMPWRDVPRLLVPSIAGCVVGSLLALWLDEGLFRHVSAALLIVIALTVFIDPKKWSKESRGGGRTPARLYPLLFILSVYGGFLQAGIGTLLLALFVLGGGYDVVRANALKFGLVPIFQLVAVAIFASAGQVDWPSGLVLGGGTIAGGVVGARLVVEKGVAWVRMVVLLSAVAAAIQLLTKG